MPNKFSYLWPRSDSKYTTYDHARTANTISSWWLVSWDLMRPIGGELVTTLTSPSCWGTHFLYLSNPPSGNLLPIIPCKHPSGDAADNCDDGDPDPEPVLELSSDSREVAWLGRIWWKIITLDETTKNYFWTTEKLYFGSLIIYV